MNNLTKAYPLLYRWKKPGNEKAYLRPYTPTSYVDKPNEVEFTIKKYDDGKMTPHLFSLKVGDEIEIGKLIQKIEYVPNKWDHVSLIGGGSGITPLYQILIHALSDTNDNTKLTLIYANKTPQDILLKSEIDDLASKHDRFNVVYTIDNPHQDWNGHVGFVNYDTIKSNIPSSDVSNQKILVCGPPGQMIAVSGTKNEKGEQGSLIGILKDLNYTEEQVFK